MTGKMKVILAHPIPPEWLASLDGLVDLTIGPDNFMGISDDLMPALISAEGLIVFLCDKVDERIINLAPNLKVICNMAAGIDNIDIQVCNRKRIPVGSTPGVLTASTADLTIGLLLAANRQIMIAADDARMGKWKMWHADKWLGNELNGTTLGIIGMGKIGSAVARRAVSFGMKIVYYSRSAKLVHEEEFGAERVDFEELLKISDIISLHAPLNSETYHIIDQDAFRRMKPGAILINTARGSEVDTNALYQALIEGRVSAAGLDVTDPEPLPPEHPLYKLSNCIILPHIGSGTFQARRKIAEMTCANLLAGLNGQQLPYCANQEIYG